MFSDYMRGAVRLSALMRLPVTYVWTHDSIGLGEDGPTHQPIEHLAALRAIPGLDVVRPADANETAAAWAADPGEQATARPVCPEPAEPADRARAVTDGFADTRGVAKGGVRPQGRRRRARGDPDRHRFRGPATPSPPSELLAAEGIARPGRLDAVPRVVRRAGPGVPRLGHPARRQGPGERRGRRRPWAGATSSATPAGSSASTTTAPAPPAPCCSRSSASPPTPWSPPPRRASPPPSRHRRPGPPGAQRPEGTGGPRGRPRRHHQLTRPATRPSTPSEGTMT